MISTYRSALTVSSKNCIIRFSDSLFSGFINLLSSQACCFGRKLLYLEGLIYLYTSCFNGFFNGLDLCS